jgi:glycosyltransferase involved in cell wall biosynthesis
MDFARDLLAGLHAADIAIFHEFKRPPYGGGNQFLLALRDELRRRGLRVASNSLAHGTRACLFNSFNFDVDRLRRVRVTNCKMVHRVDGPISSYRGNDDGTDRRIEKINIDLADATIFQSQYSLREHHKLGLKFKAPTVISNAVDPSIFFPPDRRDHSDSRRIRLISSAWSDNPRKGAATYAWIDQHLDWDKYEYTFVGRVSAQFDHIRMVAPVPSRDLASLLRAHDIYITASLHDPCSNALIEALACGLPAVYANSGGHPELVGEGGFGFSSDDEIPACLERLVTELDQRRASIRVNTLADVADRYLEVLLGTQAATK